MHHNSENDLCLQDCRIFVLDHAETITIDDCINCQIVIGPCAGRSGQSRLLFVVKAGLTMTFVYHFLKGGIFRKIGKSCRQ